MLGNAHRLKTLEDFNGIIYENEIFDAVGVICTIKCTSFAAIQLSRSTMEVTKNLPFSYNRETTLFDHTATKNGVSGNCKFYVAFDEITAFASSSMQRSRLGFT